MQPAPASSFTVQLLCIAVCLFVLSCSASKQALEESLIGWKGDTYRHDDVFGASRLAQGSFSAESRWIETVSWRPRAFVFHNFLSKEECDHIIRLAAPQMKRSTVVGGKDKGVVDNIRTSYGTFINRNSDDIIAHIEQKLANWTHLPVVNQEDIQVLRYETGQKYGAHYDALGRICTVLIYLTDGGEGGETAFPNTNDEAWADSNQKERFGPFSECAEGHVAVKPSKGTALLFYSLNPDGKTTDSAAMHTGCPIVTGIKWTTTVWMHPQAFRPESLPAVAPPHRSTPDPSNDPGLCQNTHPQCEEWAAAGECEKNPGYMTGEDSPQVGACRLACKQCQACKRGDDACYHRNRELAGYLNLAEEVKLLTGSSLPTQF